MDLPWGIAGLYDSSFDFVMGPGTSLLPLGIVPYVPHLVMRTFLNGVSITGEPSVKGV